MDPSPNPRFATRSASLAPFLDPKDARRIPKSGAVLIGATVPSGAAHGPAVAHLLSAMLAERRDLGVLCVDPKSRESRGAKARALVLEGTGHSVQTLSDPCSLAASFERGRAVVALPSECTADSDDLFWHASRVRDTAVRAGAPIVAVRSSTSATADGDAFDVRVASAVSAHTLRGLTSDADRVELLRWYGRALSARATPALSASLTPSLHAKMVDPVDPDAMAREIASLPAEARLASGGTLTVYAAQARSIPYTLREIGRLRELTFRAAGEGTGLAIDLDPFDIGYTHLFVHDAAAGQITGAYRIGETDALVPRGIEALYTSTLFRFDPRFFTKLGPALELGRSFVRPEYQRSSRTLLLLWRGIGAYVAQRPWYRHLFGPVSVSAEYTPFSRDVIARVLGGKNFRHDLSPLVEARTPGPRRTFGDGGLGDPARVLTDPADLAAIVSSAEPDSKGLPILVTEYLKLGGRFLDFNVDESFSGVLDGLVVVDLRKTDPRLLGFYMGKTEAADYLGRPAARSAADPFRA